MKWITCAIALASVPPILYAQAATRAEEIEAQQQAKQADLSPEVPGKAERISGMVSVTHVASQLPGGIPGLRLKLGGLPSGSGFAFGPEYRRSEWWHGNLALRTSAIFSVKIYQLYDFELSAPHLLHDYVLLGFHAVHRNYSSLNYYGEGPNSKKSGRSDYRLEDSWLNGTAVLQILRHLHAGMRGGYLWVNVGPGKAAAYVSTDKIYGPITTPGIDRQSNFLRGGPYAVFDYRDHPQAPHRGGFYTAGYDYYSDQKLGYNNFRQLTAEAQQYIPALHETHTIALRAKTQLSFADRGQVVPFYLQPVLGGDDMRGFRPFRFYDDNMVVLNGEYRWMVFDGLEAAIFTDQGKVFHDRAQWNLHHLESSYGFGFRFLVNNTTFMRIDTGFSREGFQIWVKFDNVF